MKKVIPADAILIPDKAKLVFEGVIYNVFQWEQPNFDDSVATFEMLRRPDTVAAICIVDDKILVLEEEQPHRGSRLTLPGGRVDPEDADTLSAAKREIKEETGYQFKHWKLVKVTQPQAKIEWFIYTYVAWGASHKGEVHHDAGERIFAKLERFADFKSLVQEGSGFLGECRYITERLEGVEDFKKLPDYKGRTVDR